MKNENYKFLLRLGMAWGMDMCYQIYGDALPMAENQLVVKSSFHLKDHCHKMQTPTGGHSGVQEVER